MKGRGRLRKEICRECRAEFETRQPNRKFCKRAHKDTWHNRRRLEGARIVASRTAKASTDPGFLRFVRERVVPFLRERES